MLQYLTRLRKKRGFTLIEVIIVLVILAILAAVAIPSLTGYIDKAREKKYMLAAKNIMKAAQIEFSELYAEGKSLKIVEASSDDRNDDSNTTWGRVEGIEGSKVYNYNGDVDLNGDAALTTEKGWEEWKVSNKTELAKDILTTAGYSDESEYPCTVIIGCGDSETYLDSDPGKAYTVYTIIFRQSDKDKFIYFDGSKYTTEYPWTTGAISNDNVCAANNVKLKFYFVNLSIWNCDTPSKFWGYIQHTYPNES